MYLCFCVQDVMSPLQEESGCEDEEGEDEEEGREEDEDEFDSDESLVDSDSDSEKGMSLTAAATNRQTALPPFPSHSSMLTVWLCRRELFQGRPS